MNLLTKHTKNVGAEIFGATSISSGNLKVCPSASASGSRPARLPGGGRAARSIKHRAPVGAHETGSIWGRCWRIISAWLAETLNDHPV
jgi:hypothetical protein